MWFHLAQFNVARPREPLTHPSMAEYAAAIPRVNALGEQAEGFIWRSHDNGDDPLVLPTLTVWASPEALRAFVYRGGHVEIMKRRSDFLLPFGGPTLALWWIPAGHLPDLAEAWQRLEHLRQHGPTHAAFTFNPPFLPPASPEAAPETALGPRPEWTYDGRLFGLVENTDNGDNRPGVTFRYRQQGTRVWATYGGGDVRFGALVARVNPQGELDMRYQHWGPGGLRTGECRSTPEWLPNGRLRLHEEWRWTNGDRTSGHGIIEELG